MASIEWIFSQVVGGQDSGFHDAGVETFKGDFSRYLARELIQNSLDARLDQNKPAEIRFSVEQVPVAEIPDAKRLATTIQACADYWPKDAKAKSFFQRAISMLRKATIPTLRVSDYNTTGVHGSDTDRNQNWYNLVRCSGSSSKGGGEGGSFGIGKNAPLAASQLRTVLYSTRTSAGVAFQGIAKLVTHSHPDGGKAQATGYLGGSHGASIRAVSALPPRFLRTHQGTDIIIVGVAATPSWNEELTFSVLENFWPAIHFKDLQVYVGDLLITSDNLERLLESYSTRDGFSAHHYYRAFTNPTKYVKADLPILKAVDLYLRVGELDLPKRVAMIRKTGMVIYPRQFRSPLRFSGVFLCRNEAGNEILRDMEPPRHDAWDPDLPEKGQNKKVDGELTSFLRENIRALTPADDSKTIMIPGLSRFLPDDEDTPEEGFEAEPEAANREESADRRPVAKTLSGQKIDPRRRVAPAQDHSVGEERSDTDGPDDEGPGPDPDGPPNDGEGGKSRRKSESGGPSDGPTRTPIPILYRTFSSDPVAGIYTAVVTARMKGAKEAVLQINGIGDDGRKNPAALKSARSVKGDAFSVTGHTVGPVRLVGGKALRIELVLGDPARVSMEVAAHEAE